MTPQEKLNLAQNIQQSGCAIQSCGCLMTIGGLFILLILALAAGI